MRVGPLPVLCADCLPVGLENPRAFPVIYGEAQVILRSKFGMELVEMRARPKAGQQPGEAAAETQATQRRDKGKGRQRNGDDDEESDEADGEATQQAGKRQKGGFCAGTQC